MSKCPFGFTSEDKAEPTKYTVNYRDNHRVRERKVLSVLEGGVIAGAFICVFDWRIGLGVMFGSIVGQVIVARWYR